MRGFFKVMRDFFKECSSYKWRWNRKKWWLYPIWMSLLLSAPLFILLQIAIKYAWEESVITWITRIVFVFGIIYIIYVQYAAYMKRLHDLDKTWWWTLLLNVPLVNIWLFIYCGFFKWTPWKNRYWDDPLQNTHTENLKSKEKTV